LTICLFFAAIAMVTPASAADAPAMVVGRVYHIEGELLRYVPQEKDWVTEVSNRRNHSRTTAVRKNR
jgi:hypothetical protein